MLRLTSFMRAQNPIIIDAEKISARAAFLGHQKQAKDIQQARLVAVRERAAKKTKQLSDTKVIIFRFFWCFQFSHCLSQLDKLVLQAYKELMEEGYDFPKGNPLLKRSSELSEVQKMLSQSKVEKDLSKWWDFVSMILLYFWFVCCQLIYL